MLWDRAGNESPISQIHVIRRRRVFDLGELLLERLPGGQKLQHGRSPNRLYNQTIPFLAEQSFIAGQLQVARNPQRLVPPVPKQPHDSFGLHGVLPAALIGAHPTRAPSSRHPRAN